MLPATVPMPAQGLVEGVVGVDGELPVDEELPVLAPPQEPTSAPRTAARAKARRIRMGDVASRPV
jgi:hypothetical protein